MVQRLVQRYPIPSLLVIWGMLICVVCWMPGEPRPADILGLTVHASKGPCSYD